MTFCLGMKIKEGLIALADTRVVSGNEMLTARKVTVHQYGHHSMFLMTSGLRSVRDKALTYFQEVLEEAGPADGNFNKLYKMVNAFAEQVRRVAQEDKAALEEAGFSFNLHALVGGQFEADAEHKLYMLYPQGNWVEVSQASPYFIIGNTGYGKPLLDRVVKFDSPLEFALKAGFLAFDATRVSANDVGFPLDVVLYRRGKWKFVQRRFEQVEMEPLTRWWQQQISDSIRQLPDDWAAELIDDLDDKAGPSVDIVAK